MESNCGNMRQNVCCHIDIARHSLIDYIDWFLLSFMLWQCVASHSFQLKSKNALKELPTTTETMK